MKIDTKQSDSLVGRWVKNSLCSAVIVGLTMSAGIAFAGEKYKEDRGNLMTPFSRIAHVPVVKDEYDNIDREATYIKAREVAVTIANYLANNDDAIESGFPADWIVGGHEGGGLPEESIMNIPSPNLIDPDIPSLGIKFANVLDLCNSYYAKQALGVAPIAGTTKKVVNGYSHATALPCEVSTWNDDENIYIDMLDPNAIFSIFFTDVLVSEDMQDTEFAAAIRALPVAVKSELKTVVYKALGEAGYKYNTQDKMIGPKYNGIEDVFEVVAASPNQSPFKHVAYTKIDGSPFIDDDAEVVAQAIINTMSIHGESDAGAHHPDLESILSDKSKWRSARHLPLGLPGKPEKNWVIEACSPTYAKMAMGTGMHHATALPCEIAVQRVDRDGDVDGTTESLVISYLDPAFMFGAMFGDMTDDEKAALGDVPGYINSDLQNIVQFALDNEIGGLKEGKQFYFTMLP